MELDSQFLTKRCGFLQSLKTALLLLSVIVASLAGGVPLSEIERHFLARAFHAWAARDACSYTTEWLVGEDTKTYFANPAPVDQGGWRFVEANSANTEETEGETVVYEGASMFPGDGVAFLMSLGLLAKEEPLESLSKDRTMVAPAFDQFDVIRSEKREMLLAVALPDQVMEGLGAHARVTMVIAGFPATVQLISILGTDLPFSPRKSMRIERFRRVIELDYEPAILGTVIRRDTIDLAGWTEGWEDFTVLGTYIYSDFDCSRRVPLQSALEFEFPVPSLIKELEIPDEFLLE